jgi:hypothetical protein
VLAWGVGEVKGRCLGTTPGERLKRTMRQVASERPTTPHQAFGADCFARALLTKRNILLFLSSLPSHHTPFRRRKGPSPKRIILLKSNKGVVSPSLLTAHHPPQHALEEVTVTSRRSTARLSSPQRACKQQAKAFLFIRFAKNLCQNLFPKNQQHALKQNRWIGQAMACAESAPPVSQRAVKVQSCGACAASSASGSSPARWGAAHVECS